MTPDIKILPFTLQDIPHLRRIDHSYHTDFVWQMEVNLEVNEINVRFKEARLPRSMRVDYPRELDDFESLLAERDLILVAHRDGEAIGYISVVLSTSKSIGIISDIAVLRRFRRQGVGSAMILAVQATLSEKGIHQVQLEMQSKNHPAIELANKLGFEFSGFSDRYYYNQDIALFFRRRL